MLSRGSDMWINLPDVSVKVRFRTPIMVSSEQGSVKRQRPRSGKQAIDVAVFCSVSAEWYYSLMMALRLLKSF